MQSNSVCIGQSSSPPVRLESGVPQGSVLGPIIFSVYVSPLGHISSHDNMLMTLSFSLHYHPVTYSLAYLGLNLA